MVRSTGKNTQGWVLMYSTPNVHKQKQECIFTPVLEYSKYYIQVLLLKW